ncbi:MAG TPA: type II secretion system protein GspM [Pseudomonas sp.]|nr:type II secretion system protein GspM [Pseudomonas sp.]
MNNWLQRWHNLASREQWLVLLVGLSLLGVFYVLLAGDPLGVRLAQRETEVSAANTRRLEAETALAELQAKLAADPNQPYHRALLAASASREELLGQIDQATDELVTPEKMRQVLDELLRKQPGLRLVGLESFSEPVKLPGAAPAVPAAPTQVEKSASPPVVLYRHGLVLQLQGGYFELLSYLQAIQASPWKLNWDSLDYQVGEAGPGQAQISLKLYTLSRKAGWVGV